MGRLRRGSEFPYPDLFGCNVVDSSELYVGDRACQWCYGVSELDHYR